MGIAPPWDQGSRNGVYPLGAEDLVVGGKIGSLGLG